MKRNFRPRATASRAIAPATATERTCDAVFGFEPDQYRAFLVDHNVPHTRLGRTVIARVDDVLEAIAHLGSTSPNANAVAVAPTNSDEPQTVDDVLASLGMKRAS